MAARLFDPKRNPQGLGLGDGFSEQGTDLLPVDPGKEEQGYEQAEHFRNGEGPPNGVYVATKAQ